MPLAKQLQPAEKGSTAQMKPVHQRLGALTPRVTADDEFFLWRRKFLQADVQPPQSPVEMIRHMFTLAGKQVEHVRAEEQGCARRLLAMLLDLQVSESERPRQERTGGVELLPFAIKSQAGLLLDVPGILLDRYQSIDITKDGLLVLGEQEDQVFGA